MSGFCRTQARKSHPVAGINELLVNGAIENPHLRDGVWRYYGVSG
jgi:hypothetical protein